MCNIHSEIFDCKRHVHSVKQNPCKSRNDEDHPCKALGTTSSTKGNCPKCNPSKDALESTTEQAAGKATGELQVRERERLNAVSEGSQTSEQTESPTEDNIQPSEIPGPCSSTDVTTSTDESDLPKYQRDLFRALQAADKESDKELAECLNAADDMDEELTAEGLTEFPNAAAAAEKIRHEFERLNRDLWE